MDAKYAELETLYPGWKKLRGEQRFELMRKVGILAKKENKRPGKYRLNDGTVETVKADGSQRFDRPDGGSTIKAKDGKYTFIASPEEEALDADQNAYWDSRRSEEKEERRRLYQEDYDRKQDQKFGLIPGTTAGFDKVITGVGKAAFEVVDNTIGKIPIAGSAWKAFAPAGSSQYSTGSVEDKFKQFGKGLGAEAIGAVANAIVPGSGSVARKGADSLLAFA